MMNFRIARPEHLIDINRIEELTFIRNAGDHIEIGALTRHATIEHDPLLAQRLPILPKVAKTIAHYAIRSQGTLGGSLAHADPAAQWPLLALALGATMIARSQRGERAIPAKEFFVATMTTALAADELLVATHWPVLTPQTGWGFEIFTRRRGDFALVALVALARVERGQLAQLQVFIGGATPIPCDISSHFTSLNGCDVDDSIAVNAGQIAAQVIKPDDDSKAAGWYRTELIATLVQRAVQQALAR